MEKDGWPPAFKCHDFVQTKVLITDLKFLHRRCIMNEELNVEWTQLNEDIWVRFMFFVILILLFPYSILNPFGSYFVLTVVVLLFLLRRLLQLAFIAAMPVASLELSSSSAFKRQLLLSLFSLSRQMALARTTKACNVRTTDGAVH